MCGSTHPAALVTFGRYCSAPPETTGFGQQRKYVGCERLLQGCRSRLGLSWQALGVTATDFERTGADLGWGLILELTRTIGRGHE